VFYFGSLYSPIGGFIVAIILFFYNLYLLLVKREGFAWIPFPLTVALFVYFGLGLYIQWYWIPHYKNAGF
jgi:hypothetical protein